MKKLMSLVMIMAACFMTEPVTAVGLPGTNEVSAITAVADMLPSIEKMKEYSGFGAQIGIALKGAVSALGDGVQMSADQVNKFAATPVGKLVAFTIIYKVIGKELLQSFIGFVILFIISIALCKFWKGFWFGCKTVKAKTKDGTEWEFSPSIFERAEKIERGSGFVVAIISATISMVIVAMTISFMF